MFIQLNETVQMPKRSTIESAGYDIFALNDITIQPSETITVELGFTIEDENPNHVYQVLPRSSTGIKKGLRVLTHRGEMVYGCALENGESTILVKNDSESVLFIPKGEHFAQIVITNFDLQYQAVEFESVRSDELQKFEHSTFSGSILPIQTENGTEYHFITNEEIVIKKGAQIQLPIKTKARIENGTYLGSWVSDTYKHLVYFPNLVPIIDADYYGSAGNDGHIFFAFRGKGDETIVIPSGKHLCTFRSIPYLTVEGEIKPTEIRTAGIGSTSK